MNINTFKSLEFLFKYFLFFFFFSIFIFERRDLHLDDVTDTSLLTDTKFLVKRATDAITFKDDDTQDTTYEYS